MTAAEPAFDLAVVGADPLHAEPASGAVIDAARRVVRLGAAPPGARERLGARPGEPLSQPPAAWLEELARGPALRAYLCGFDPRPLAAPLAAGLAAGRFELAGALHRALGVPPADHALAPGYRTNPVAYFDDTPHTDEWQREVYDLARELAEQHGWRRIADLGCGSGYKLVHWFPEPQYRTLGLDLERTVRFLRERYPERRWLALDLEREDMLALDADLIIAADVIEHLADPDLLLGFLARCRAQAIVLSTPDAATLVAAGQREAEGPPGNLHHVREWTLAQFARYVGSRFELLHQELHPAHATQIAVCRPAAAEGSASAPLAAAALRAERAPAALLLAPERACRERSRTRELERLLRAAADERVAVSFAAELALEPEPGTAPGALTLYAPAGAGEWNPVDGLLGAHCSRAELLRALADERGPHGPERALLRLCSAAAAPPRVRRVALELTPAAQLAQLDALVALHGQGGRWPDPRPLLGPAVRRAAALARQFPALLEDLRGFWAAHGGEPLSRRPQLARAGVNPSAPELAVPIDPGAAWLALDPEQPGALGPVLAHAASLSKVPLHLLLPWSAGWAIEPFAQQLLAALAAAGLAPEACAPLVVLERPLFSAELAWVAEHFPAWRGL